MENRHIIVYTMWSACLFLPTDDNHHIIVGRFPLAHYYLLVLDTTHLYIVFQVQFFLNVYNRLHE